MFNCLFCTHEIKKNSFFENEFFFCIFDKYPVEKGHVLIISKRHISDYFDLEQKEHDSLYSLIKELKNALDSKFQPDGYNIGINNGKVSGQTIMHLHIHLIPRYKNDSFDPTGGVRGVIPEKQKY